MTRRVITVFFGDDWHYLGHAVSNMTIEEASALSDEAKDYLNAVLAVAFFGSVEATMATMKHTVMTEYDDADGPPDFEKLTEQCKTEYETRSRRH